MKAENPTRGAPRIHGELLQLGFTIAEPTVSRYLQQLKRRPDKGKAQQWLAFLNNHREVIGAFDSFTVPSLTFRTLYCFLSSRTIDGESCTSMSRHTRRPIGSCKQLRQALPLPCPYRYILFDRDGKFGNDVFEFLKASGIQPIRTSARSP